ncbi:putative coiled-coil domain-containing protein 195 [Rhynchocyon petersi]
MEANVQHTQVIQEMRAKIKKLEKENQTLQMKLISREVMIVRRYPISSSMHPFAAMDPWKAGKKHSMTRTRDSQGTVSSPSSSSVNKQNNKEKKFSRDSRTCYNSS